MEAQLILPVLLTPDRGQKRLALIVALLVPVPFVAIIPVGQIQLPQVDSYIPVVDTVMWINDSIAAALLLAQFSIMRSPSLLALAGGFLLSAFLVIPHALTFPGAFSPNGLLGAGLQTTPWLNEFWFLGLPSAVIAYVLLKRAKPIPRHAVPFSIFTMVMAVFLVTCVLLWLTTDGIEFLPVIMSDPVHPQLAWHFVPLVVLSIIAMLLLWLRRHSLLDLWLLVVLEAWMLNALMFNKLVTRFSFFWYAGRVFSALAASIVLIFLLSEMTVLYWRLARSHMMLERERENKLMNLEAMAGSISHEVRQPLAAIATNSAAAKRFLGHAPPNLEESLAALDRIVVASHHASQVFDNIRALFGSADQAQEPVDLNELVRGTLHALRGDLDARNIKTFTELTFELPLVMGHGGQLQEVILNLARNAIEAMDAIKDRGRVLRLRTQHDDRTVTVVIQDTGPGIDPKKKDSIFEAFNTTKPKGMGLGLAICRMIIDRHGGQLTASSDGKRGALFQFVLPIKSPLGPSTAPPS
jgi:signal transduction histidine kinase